MTNKLARSRILLIASIALRLVAITVGATYQYRIEQQRQADEATALIELGISQFKQKQYKEALETLHSIPQGVVEDWRIAYYTGSTLIKLKDYESAAVSLEEALILNSKEKDIPFALGIVYFKLGNLNLSKNYFHSVLEIDPGNKEAKGLMDIMANLERIQPDASASDSGAEKSAASENVAQPVNVMPSDEGQKSTGN